MRLLVTFIFLGLFLSCGGPQTERGESSSKSQAQTKKSLLVTGLKDSKALRAQAQALGIQVSGDVILRLEGDAASIDQLGLGSTTSVVEDTPIAVVSESSSMKSDDLAYYLAKKDMGAIEFLRKYPKADGRGVIVGVLDDGISPQQVGFRKTTTGERKILKRGSNSRTNSYVLVKENDLFVGTVDEAKLFFGPQPDLNGDGKISQFKAQVSEKICLDLNLDEKFSDDECKGAFSKTGEFYVLPGSSRTVMAEFDVEKGVLSLTQPELTGDSHGEGVAAVMAAHFPGRPEFDGVAPGAQIVDYDLSEITGSTQESYYTMGTILSGIEWLAQNGAEVVNISYSLFFSSVKSQAFMAQAIDALVKKYNVVLSFSAGNNGPGLGSLNRRATYPDSVLVAGAFVSKELDERVWGVTGLPEEGRIVYYSSRGPGPLGEGGPLLIAPLSSLTHSDSESGFRAFNGTSSASPALAGTATLLVSAIKSLGMKVDAVTVVHALRLSGQQLKGEPFVAQGYGMPKLEAALEWYKKLINGEQFSMLTISTNRNGRDGMGSRGVVIYTSQSELTETARVDITGVLSGLAPVSTRAELVIPLKITYSDGISGARSLWASVSGSRFHIDIDPALVLAGQDEGFGEIRLLDGRDNTLLSIVPVTVINDRPVSSGVRQVLTVGAQGSARLHLNADEGVKMFRVRSRMVKGEMKGLNILTYDADSIRQQQLAFGDETFVTVSKPGHQQIALIMAGGTAREASVEVSIEPVKMELLNSTTSATRAVLKLRHTGIANIFGNVTLRLPSEVLMEKMSDFGGEVKEMSQELKISKMGTYSARILPIDRADMSYFSGGCRAILTNPEGKVTLSSDSTVRILEDKEHTVQFFCMPFDQGIKGDHGGSWVMRMVKNTVNEVTSDLALGMRGSKNVEFSTAQTPGKYEVWFTPHFSSQAVKLGDIQLL